MFGRAVGESSIYGLNLKTRCVSAVASETESTRFMVGTISLQEENEVHVVQVPDDGRPELELKTLLRHPAGEIWQLQPSPLDGDLFFSVYSPTDDSTARHSASLWKINHEADTLEEQMTVEAKETTCVQWQPNGRGFASLSDEEVVVWKMKGSEAEEVIRMGKEKLAGESVPVLRWDPFFKTQIATAAKSAVISFDTKSGKEAWCIPDAHAPQVRDIDFNPLKPYCLATGGDDCAVRFWDYRKTSEPILDLEMHSHWVWCVRHNPSYDQLLVSSSSDTFVNLWDVSSVSSSAQASSSSTANRRTASGVQHLLKRYDEHEDSVYTVAWGCGMDPFVFAALSYDGRLVVCRVPQEEQDRVLLSS